MHSIIHSIVLEPSKCVGCTNCIKQCPTEAIRVKNGESQTIKERCINCGQCILACPRHARYGTTDDLEALKSFSYNIALVDPVLYGQFNEIITPAHILNGIMKLGFDDVSEISVGADIVTECTKNLITSDFNKPIISSACPTIVRLIQIRFPELIDHILPIDSPVEITAQISKKKASKKLGIKEEEIGVFYITPCPARIYSFKKPVGIKVSQISGTLSIKSAFIEISKSLDMKDSSLDLFYPSGKGIGWARTGGQSQSLGIKEYLAVDGIKNVISVLDAIENQKINDLLFLECHACTNGCVGGSLTIENSFVARNRIRRLVEKHFEFKRDNIDCYNDCQLTEALSPIQVGKLDEDLLNAIKKMDLIERILADLPNIDCGACGSPSCRALAEDIALGYGIIDDCIVILKHQLSTKDFEKPDNSATEPKTP